MNTKRSISIFRKTIAFISFLIALILLFLFKTIKEFLIDFSIENIKEGEMVNSNEIFIIALAIAALISIFFIVGIILITYFPERTREALNKVFQLDRVNDFLIKDPLTTINGHTYFIVALSIVLGTALQLYLLFFGQPVMEGAIEKVGTIPFFIATVVLVFSPMKINRLNLSKKNKRKTVFTIVTLALFIFILFMEEISWGQRIFGIESFGVFKEKNFQSELNFHNFFNPLYRILYPLFGMGFFLVLFLMWFFTKSKIKESYVLNLLIPHPCLYPLAFMLACSSYNGSSEIFEQLLGLFFMFYAFRVLFCIYFPERVNLSVQKQ